MDKIPVSGTGDMGSIPVGGTSIRMGKPQVFPYGTPFPSKVSLSRGKAALRDNALVIFSE